MKEKQVLKQAIDTMYSKKPTDLLIAYSEKSGVVGTVFKGTLVHLFYSKFPLSFDKEKAMSLDNIIPDDFGYETARPTHYKKIKTKWTDKEVLACKIENENTYVWVNNDFLKHFENPTFEIKNRIDLVRVLERGILVGIICPINYTED